MGLSDEDRRRLQELEDEFYADYSSPARKPGRGGSLGTPGAWKIYGLLAVVASFALLITGATVRLAVLGVIGFLLSGVGAYILLVGYRWQGRPK